MHKRMRKGEGEGERWADITRGKWLDRRRFDLRKIRATFCTGSKKEEKMKIEEEEEEEEEEE